MKKLLIVLISISFLAFGNCVSQTKDSVWVIDYHNMELDVELAKKIRRDLNYATPLSLAFCFKELLYIIKTDPDFEQRWNKKCKEYTTVFSDKYSYEYLESEIQFFIKNYDANNLLFTDLPTQGSFLKKIQSIDMPKNNLFDIDYLIQDYQSSDSKRSISIIFFKLLILSPQLLISHFERNQETLKTLSKWCEDIPQFEFVDNGSVNYESRLIIRRKNFLLQTLKTYENENLKKVFEAINKAQVRVID